MSLQLAVSEWLDSGLALEHGFNHDPRLPSSGGVARCLTELARVFNYSCPHWKKKAPLELGIYIPGRRECMCAYVRLCERGPGPQHHVRSW